MLPSKAQLPKSNTEAIMKHSRYALAFWAVSTFALAADAYPPAEILANAEAVAISSSRRLIQCDLHQQMKRTTERRGILRLFGKKKRDQSSPDVRAVSPYRESIYGFFDDVHPDQLLPVVALCLNDTSIYRLANGHTYYLHPRANGSYGDELNFLINRFGRTGSSQYWIVRVIRLTDSDYNPVTVYNNTWTGPDSALPTGLVAPAFHQIHHWDLGTFYTNNLLRGTSFLQQNGNHVLSIGSEAKSVGLDFTQESFAAVVPFNVQRDPNNLVDGVITPDDLKRLARTPYQYEKWNWHNVLQGNSISEKEETSEVPEDAVIKALRKRKAAHQHDDEEAMRKFDRDLKIALTRYNELPSTSGDTQSYLSRSSFGPHYENDEITTLMESPKAKRPFNSQECFHFIHYTVASAYNKVPFRDNKQHPKNNRKKPLPDFHVNTHQKHCYGIIIQISHPNSQPGNRFWATILFAKAKELFTDTQLEPHSFLGLHGTRNYGSRHHNQRDTDFINQSTRRRESQTEQKRPGREKQRRN